MPFKHAVVDDPYYKEIAKQNYDKYWEKLSTKVPAVSDEFKDLFVRLIALDPTSRPSISDARNHKWIFGYKANLGNINKEFTERTKIVQTKKEIERKKEEEEEKARELKSQSQNKYKVFKSGNGENIELDISPNDYPIREYDESDRNPYTIIMNGFTDPGKIFDFIQMRLLLLKGLEVKKTSDEKYKLTIGIDPATQDVDYELGGDFLIDKVEALLELKSLDDKFVIELSRLSGNKYDYHRLFN